MSTAGVVAQPRHATESIADASHAYDGVLSSLVSHRGAGGRLSSRLLHAFDPPISAQMLPASRHPATAAAADDVRRLHWLAGSSSVASCELRWPSWW